MATWDNLVPSSLWLLQVDLTGHSQWMQNSISKPDAASARAELAERLSNALKLHSFVTAFWAGDGGLYTCRKEFISADLLSKAIDETFRCFEAWRSDESFKRQNRDRLDLRVSLHTDEVYVHANTGYWYSDGLSWFLKHERDLSQKGTAVITHDVYQLLSRNAQALWHYFREVKIADDVKWRVYSYSQSRPSTSIPVTQEEPSSSSQGSTPAAEDKDMVSMAIAALGESHSARRASELCSRLDEIAKEFPDENGLGIICTFLESELEDANNAISDLSSLIAKNQEDGDLGSSLSNIGHASHLGDQKKKQRALKAALEKIPKDTKSAPTELGETVITLKKLIMILMK